MPVDGPDWRQAFVGTTLQVQLRTTHEMTVMTPVGVLSVSSSPHLRDLLLKCLADQPAALIIELDRLRAIPLSTLSMFGVVSRVAAVWSGVPLLLVAAGQMNADLHSAVLGDHVGVHASMEIAIAGTRTAALRQIAVWHLRGEPSSAAFARQQLRDTCTAWSQPASAGDVVMLAEELVSNAIRENTGEDLILRVELRGTLLTVAVTDASSTPAIQPTPHTPQQVDQSLDRRIISMLAAASGTSPTLSGGSTAWAVLQLGS
jgi:hypothetical protein